VRVQQQLPSFLPLVAGLVAQPWQYRWSSCPAYALGAADSRLSYNVWYQGLGAAADQRQQRWREFLLGDDAREEVVRRGDWTIGEEGYRRRLACLGARPARRHGRPRKPPPGQEGFFPQFYADTQDT
jgi:hypothetical protein